MTGAGEPWPTLSGPRCETPTVDVDDEQRIYELALERVMRDLHATSRLRPEVQIDFTSPKDLQYWYESRHAYGLHRGTVDIEDATVELADLVQNDVLEDLWGTAWPACPGHDHPASPRMIDGMATWVCGKTGAKLADVGNLSATNR
jgi:hypothetical protein